MSFDHLMNHPHKPRKRLGQHLKELHQHRIKADYHDNLGELPVNKAGRALVQARKIAGSLEELFHD